jgi:ankyrin repeat protein
MVQFKYDPINLEGHSFRLLRLYKGDFGNVRCEIFNAYLNDKSINNSEADTSLIEYEALSYTWGGSYKAHDIEVGDGMMAVTKNLSLALRSLRKSDEDRILWIDAVCIDQENDKEKSHQVHQMGLIYAQAARVLIWLGSSTLMTDLVFDEMSRFEKRVVRRKCGDLDVSDEQYQGALSSVHILDGNGETQLTFEAENGLEDLLRRPWFERAWIIQEVANARYARVACGAKSVLAQTFALFPYLCKITPSQHCQAILDVMPGPTREHSWWKKSHDLNTLLLRFKGSQASDPRDKIYALLGISSDRSTETFPLPDYEKSELEVVKTVLNYLLRQHAMSEEASSVPDSTIVELLQHLKHYFNELFLRKVENGDLEKVKFLLDMGKVDPNFENSRCQTPLLRAVETEHESMTKLLINASKVDLNHKNGRGQTPLLLALEKGCEAIVRLLVDKDRVCINYENILGQTPLLQAIKQESESLVKVLIGSGRVHINSYARGRTPLLEAIQQEHVSIVDLLIHQGKADLNFKGSWDRCTPLHRAVEIGHEAIVRLMVDTGKADLNSRSMSGDTPLLEAAGNGLESIVELLIDTRQVNINTVNRQKQTPLLLATREGHERIVRLLIEKGKADVNIQSIYGETPLLVASSKGNQAIVKYILDTGTADLGLQDASGRTPLDYARSEGYENIVELLEEYGAS